METNIQFFQPSKELKEYVRYYIVTEIMLSETGKKSLDHFQIQIPDGEPELHIGYHDTTADFSLNKKNYGSFRSTVVGVNSLNNVLGLSALKRPHKCIIVKFKTHGLYEIFKVPLSAFFDQIIETNLIFGKNIETLYNKLDDSLSLKERMDYIDKFLLSRLKLNKNKKSNIKRCLQAVEIMKKHKGNIPMASMYKQLAISERPLQRDFRIVTGLSPKEFCRTIRFNYMFDTINASKSNNYSNIIDFCGYYDQAHLINDFKSATTLTPEWFIKNKNQSVFKIFNELVFPEASQLNSSLCGNLTSISQNSFQSFIKAIK